MNQDFLNMINVVLQYHDDLVKHAEETGEKYEAETSGILLV
jgi:hypothetical protein